MATGNDKKRIKAHVRRHGFLNGRRQGFFRTYEDLSKVLLTRRGGFFEQDLEEGEIRTEEIFDGTGMQAARSLANTTGAMIRPEKEVFAKVVAEQEDLNEDDEAALWLADTTERFDSAIRNPKARFRQTTGEVDLDLVVFGEGLFFNGISKNLSNLMFQSVHLKDGLPFYDSEGILRGVYRKKRMMLWQMIEQFGIENISPEYAEKIKEDKLDDRVEVLHAVTPRQHQKIRNPIRSSNLPYENLWMDLETDFIMEDSGFHEMPFVAPRWDTTSGEDHGRSPGMIALPDVNTAQAMGETILIAGQKNADPALMVPDDGIYNPVNTFAGALTYYDVDVASSIGGNPFFPLISGANLPITRDMQSDTRNQIMAAFFKNILNLPIQGPQMTATEVMARKDEFIREVGPVFGRFETDYNQPAAERQFAVMLRAGGFAPIPEILQGQNIKFEFELPVTKIRKQIEAAAALQWVGEIIELGRAFPEALDLPNIDALARFSADAKDLPHDVVNGRDMVTQIRKAKAEALAKQQQAANIDQGLQTGQQMADIAETAGKVEQLMGETA